MAYSLKVLEKGANDTIDASVSPANMFKYEATGYTGYNCAGVHSGHKWTVTGNAAATSLLWFYDTAVAVATGSKIFFHAKMKITTVGATMSNLVLTISGTTSGNVVVKTQNSPVVGTEYVLFGVADIAGLVGNYRLGFFMSDDVSTNGVAVEIYDWVAIDLTTMQGAGHESSAADMERYILWRMEGWTWIDWFRYANGIDYFYRWERIDGHGWTSEDVRARSSPMGSANGIVPIYVIDANWYATSTLSILGGLSPGDTITPYIQTDRTNKVLANSLRVDLRSDIEASVSCEMIGDSTWQPLCGMTVLLYDGTELLHTGKIRSVSRTRYNGSTKWKCAVEIGTMTETLSRCAYDWTTPLDNYSSGAAVDKIRQYSLNLIGGMGILPGRIDDGISDIGEYDATGKSAYEAINELAKAAGMVWYVDKHRKLHFRTPILTPATAAHALVDGNGYEDYSNVEYSQSIEQYRTRQDVIGGYSDAGDLVKTNRTLDSLSVSYPISIDTEASGNLYLAIMRNETLETLADAEATADVQLKTYGAQVPCKISFESGSTDWRPNTDLTVQLQYLGIASPLHFNIDSVEMFDANGLTIRSRVSASQRDPSNFASAPNSGPSEFLSDLQAKAQNSVGTVHNGDSEAVLLKHWLTPEGGIAIRMTNATAGLTVHGQIVQADTASDNSFKTAVANSDMPIGVVYNSGVDVGGEAWVVVAGIAEVLMKNTVAPVHGYVAYASSTAGRADCAGSIPASTEHWREIGHILESKAGGTDVLAKMILHFN